MDIRIETGYVWGEGYSHEQGKAFNTIVIALAEHLNLKYNLNEHETSAPVIYTEDLENIIYCHPMELTGSVSDVVYNKTRAFSKEIGIFAEERGRDIDKDWDWLKKSIKKSIK